MKPMPQTAPSGPVGVLLRRRLKELERTPADLAEAVQLPIEYIEDLLSGRRRPPQPGWTDLYDRMTQYLKFGRNELSASAIAERIARAEGPKRADARVRELMLTLCDPATAAGFQSKAGKPHPADPLAQRLLEVVQASVRHDTMTYRATMRPGRNHVQMRGRVFEFLDITIESLTVADFEEFVRPRVATWDVDRDSGVLKVVFCGRELRPIGVSATTRAPTLPPAEPAEPDPADRPAAKRAGARAGTPQRRKS